MFRLPALLALALLPLLNSQPLHDGPTYTADGQLAFPTQYREWVFLGAGLDMSYDKNVSAPTHSMFNTVFVNPSAYARFKQTGHWPEGTEMVLENSGAISDASINKRGKTMSGELMGVEVHVLESQHGQSGWGFYSFDNPVSAKLIPATASCYSCHQQHAAVDTTFVQFYPALLEVARAKHTLDPKYVKAEGLDPK
jgi:hypothetical protein